MIEKILLSLLAGCVWLCLHSASWAQSPESTGERDTNAVSFLRGWIAGSGGLAVVSLSTQGRKDEEARELCSAAAGGSVVNPGYSQVAYGNHELKLKSGGKVLRTMTTDLDNNTSYTLLAWREGGTWELKVYHDGPASPNVPTRPLRLMNFAEGRETLFSLDNGPETKVAADTVQEFQMPVKLGAFTVKVLKQDGGPSAQSSGEVDFASAPSAYVVIAPDYRGRMRPRTILGGIFPTVEE
jgi:hypothetical protein